MPDVSVALPQVAGHRRQRQTLDDLNSVGWLQQRQTAQNDALRPRLPTSSEIGIGRLGQPGKQLGPLGFRPVLAFAAAARVDGQPRSFRQVIEGEAGRVRRGI